MHYFGTDGIRDRAGEGRLAPEVVTRLGRALARFVSEAQADDGSPCACLGLDPRPSGPALAALIASALGAEGVEVVDIGIVPSPAVPWIVSTRGFDLGIAVSASHNPAPDNGLKMFVDGGRKLTVAEEERVESIMQGLDDAQATAPSPTRIDGAAAYVAAAVPWLAAEGRLDGLHLVVDLSAGAASATAPAVLEGLGATVSAMHEAGTRPINDACGTEHPRAWRDAVARDPDTLGIAFDGDADRMLLADAGGEILDGDDALAILASDWRERGRLPGDVVVGTVMTNFGLEERLARQGIRLERTAVGDRNVAERMRTLGAVLGGEPSGHLVGERDGAMIGDGLVAAVRVLQAAARSGRSLAALREETPRYPQVLRNVRMRERRALQTYPAILEAIRVAEGWLEGTGRMVVRFSGTEPVLRVMAEGRDAYTVERAVASVEAEARKEA
ncbi:MAG: phosphohexomutase domain-containing protein [Planctomycetota bacterium]|jgi:phosphoglucosamine mutase